jgi:hypothetical protein
MTEPNTASLNRKSLRVVGITFLVYAVLVATHLGEFWPFSIYPMFSQAGRPWSRAIVRDVTDTPAGSIVWERVGAMDLPGDPVALTDHGVDPIDLANFVSKTQSWDDARVEGLRKMFRADRLEGQWLLVLRAGGEMNETDSVVVYFEPYVILHRNGAEVNPALPR